MAITRLTVYNDEDAGSIAAAAIFKHRYDDADNTLKNLADIASGDIDTWIGTLGATTLDYIFVANPAAGGAVEGKLDTLQLNALLAALKVTSAGAIVGALYENATTFTSATIGLAGAGWTVNEHAGRFVKITAGTGANQMAYILSNTATVLTIAGTFTTTPDATSDFEIWEDIGINYLPLTAGSKLAAMRAWEIVYPLNVAYPQIVHWLGSELYSVIRSTATSLQADGLTETGKFGTVNQYAGYWLAIIDGTAGIYQKRKVVSNTANKLTISPNWTYTPTGTVIYRLFSEDKEVLYDVYASLYIKTKMFDLTDAVMWDKWKSIIGTRGSAEVLKFLDLPPVVDQPVLDTMIAEGKIMADYALDSVSRYV